MCVVDRVLDDGSAVAQHLGRTTIVEGAFECTEVAVGPYVLVPRVSSAPIAEVAA